MKKIWKLHKPDPYLKNEIRRTLGCSDIIAAILANRDLGETADLRAFWQPSLQLLRPPFTLKDMNTAVACITEAIIQKENILIFGDYDADGISATAVLYHFLNDAGANVSAYIPHRVDEGYGLQPFHITDVATKKNIHLIITVDCGSADHDAVSCANAADIRVVITDHHRISREMPSAAAIVNPQRQDCSAGLEHLSGVGVAYYLVIALRSHLRELGFWENRPEPNLKNLCDLVALGTIADMVPLVAENRILCRIGMDIIGRKNRAGLTALMHACRMVKEQIDSDDIAFRLAPRLNAAGRMQHADPALQLLITDNPETAATLAQGLCRLNDARQITEKEMLSDVNGYLRDHPGILDKKTLVLAHGGWNAGLLGIVCAKLVEQFQRPAVLISTQNGIGKGSARSIPGIDLYQTLVKCSELLEAYGGHQMAAGLSIRPEQIDLFQSRFETVVTKKMQSLDTTPVIMLDCMLELNAITDQLLDQITALQPFGTKNPEPVFLARNVLIQHAATVGKTHRRMRLSQNKGNTGSSFNAIQFNAPPLDITPDQPYEMIYKLRWNYWNGRKSTQLLVEEIRPMEV